VAIVASTVSEVNDNIVTPSLVSEEHDHAIVTSSLLSEVKDNGVVTSSLVWKSTVMASTYFNNNTWINVTDGHVLFSTITELYKHLTRTLFNTHFTHSTTIGTYK